MTRRLRMSAWLRLFAVLGGVALCDVSHAQPVHEFPVPTAGAAPEDIAAGPDGALWFTEKDASKIGRITTQGAFTEYPLTPGVEPEGITGGPDGNVWFTERHANAIGRITPQGALTEFPVSAGSVPTAIASGPDGNLWFTERSGNSIGRITPSGVVTEFPLPSGSSGPDSIAAGSDGRLWFGMQISSQIGRISTSGNIEVSPLPPSGVPGGGGATPRDVTTGPDQNIWVTLAVDNPTGGAAFGALLRIVPASCTPSSCTITPFPLIGRGALEGIVTGPDNQLWVVDRANAKVIRVSTAGTPIDDFSLTAGSNPKGIASGPDSAVWVAEDDGNRIARIASGGGGPTPTPTTSPTPTPTPTPGNLPDLSVSKTVAVSGAAGSQTLLYTLTYGNAGGVPSPDVLVHESVPFFTSFQPDASDPRWSCDPPPEWAPIVGGGACQLHVGPLGPGQTGTASFSVVEGLAEVALPDSFPIYNLASILGDGGDANASDNLFDLATPEASCDDAATPVDYLLCLFHGASEKAPPPASKSWLGGVLQAAREYIDVMRICYRTRDFLITSPGGRAFYFEYHALSPEIRSLLGSDATLRNLGLAVIGSWEPAVQALIDGNGGGVTFTQAMSDDMVAFLDRLAQIGVSPELRAQAQGHAARVPSLVGRTMQDAALYFDQTPCEAGQGDLCLNGGRFRVHVDWRVPAQGRRGVGTPVSLTDDTGYFWFFNDANVELVVKALDGRPVNQHYWVFYGALSNVEYTLTVTDTHTGVVRTYTSASGDQASVGDTGAFAGVRGPAAADGRDDAELYASFAALSPPPPPEPATDACTAGSDALCLNGNRFRVSVDWEVPKQGRSGHATAVPITGDTGYLWFFTTSNVELVVKVLDGRSVNGHYWVFYGALSNVKYTITVKDTVTGAVRTYDNPDGLQASFSDTSAF